MPYRVPTLTPPVAPPGLSFAEYVQRVVAFAVCAVAIATIGAILLASAVGVLTGVWFALPDWLR